jgi:hypothetical protein
MDTTGEDFNPLERTTFSALRETLNIEHYFAGRPRKTAQKKRGYKKKLVHLQARTKRRKRICAVMTLPWMILL